MTKTSFLLAATASALAASPALARPMTATDMHMMHRIGAPSVSPDGRTAIFTISDTDLKANKRKNTLYSLDLTREGAKPVPVKGIGDGHDAVFGGDGAIWYLAPVKEQDQLFRMTLGGRAAQVSTVKGEISGFKISRDGSRLVLFADRDTKCTDFECKNVAAPTPAGSARTYDQLFVRHWDAWTAPGSRSRLFAFPIQNGRVTGGGAVVSGPLIGDTPSKPFGGGEEIAVSPDGKMVYFALREAGRIEPTSTNLDIFSAPADGSAAPVNLTANNKGTDNLPTLSPDGRHLAYVSMARAGYEADRQVLMVRDLANGQVRALTKDFDRSVASIAWAPDSRSLLITAEDTLEQPIYRVDAASGALTRLTKEGTFGNVVATSTGAVIATMNSVFAPDDLYLIGDGGKIAQLTNVNAAMLSQLDPITFEKVSFKGANNDTVWGYSLKPVRAGKLPVVLLVHGGPQGSFSNSWSYRWNPRLFSAPGYAVTSVDFHGSTGYGQAFTDSINRNWGGWPLEDLKKGLKHMTDRDPQLMADNVCAAGASYGGFMMNWIEGNWPDRFKCLVQHDGIFDNRAMAYETEELWFTEWEHGAKPYYEAPGEYEKYNPVNHVAKWKTPMLVVAGEKDFRVPYTQGIAAFTALQRRDVPSRLVVFPDENHWVLKPRNSIQWYDEVFGWLNRWLGPGATR